jgi:hypothetical protein
MQAAADDVMQASSWREQAELDKALASTAADKMALQVGRQVRKAPPACLPAQRRVLPAGPR